MASDFTQKARSCCRKAKERIVERLEYCNSRGSDSGFRHRCYRSAARKGGREARQCMLA